MNEEVIYRNRPLLESENYSFLRGKALEFVENMGSALWTDYNIHDPGITILELFCYAITDLGYQTNQHITDLLTRETQEGVVNVGQFHRARDILTSNPVTLNDLLKLVLDTEGVRSAAVKKHTDTFFELSPESESLQLPREGHPDKGSFLRIKGLYEVCIDYEESVDLLRLGELNNALIRNGFYKPVPEPGQGMRLEILQDVILESVSVYPRGEGTVLFLLQDMQGNEVSRQEVLVTARDRGKKTQIPFFVELFHSYEQPDRNFYQLLALSDHVQLFAHPHAEFPIESAGFARLVGNTEDTSDYLFFYDWDIEPTAHYSPNIRMVRKQVGLADRTRTKQVEYFAPDEGEMYCTIQREVILEAVTIYPVFNTNLSSTPVILSLVDADETIVLQADGNACETRIAIPNAKSDSPFRVSLAWKLDPGTDYRMRIRTAEEMNPESVLFCASLGASFTQGDEASVLLTGNTPLSAFTAGQEQTYFFFYCWEIRYEEEQAEEQVAKILYASQVKRNLRKRLLAHRNLCEDFLSIREAETEEIGLTADVSLDLDAQPEEVQAEILFKLEQHIRPPVRFHTLEEMVDRGRPSDEIFDGPALEHGFIETEDLERGLQRTEVRVSDVLRIIMAIPAVLSVNKIRLYKYKHGKETGKDTDGVLRLSGDFCSWPNFQPDKTCVNFFKQDLSIPVDNDLARQLLDTKIQTSQRRKLHPEKRDFPIPVGRPFIPAAYYPMQFDLPAVYMVGRHKVPASAPASRKVQSCQLKAYLMFFEQLLANYMAQLQNVHRLFQWDPTPTGQRVKSYFTQAVSSIEGLEHILISDGNLDEELEALVEDDATALSRKQTFLDHLLARFGESFADYSLVLFNLFQNKEDAIRQLIRDKQQFLSEYPDLSRKRAQGLDYRNGVSLGSPLPGFQQRLYRLLGFQEFAFARCLPEPLEWLEQQGGNWKFRWCLNIPTNATEGETLEFHSTTKPNQQEALGLLDLIQALDGEVLQEEWVREGDRWVLCLPCPEADHPLELGYALIPEAGPSAGEVRDVWQAELRNFEWDIQPSRQPHELSLHPLADPHFSIRQEEVPESEDAASGEENGNTAEVRWFFAIGPSLPVEEDADKPDVQQGKSKTPFFESERYESKTQAEYYLEKALEAGSELANYRFNLESCVWELFWCRKGHPDKLIGATLAPHYRKQVYEACTQAHGVEGFQLVEHLLLRPRASTSAFLPVQLPSEEEPERVIVSDPYSFRITIVLPSWSRRFQDINYRGYVERVIREETPAHIFPNILWTNFAQFQAFESSFFDWLTALDKLPASLGGSTPVPEILPEALRSYDQKLKKLIDDLFRIREVRPQAQLYDPDKTEQKSSNYLLGNISLGTTLRADSEGS